MFQICSWQLRQSEVGGIAGRRRLLHQVMAVAAVDAFVADVVAVIELHRLVHRRLLLREERRAHVDHRAGDRPREQQRDHDQPDAEGGVRGGLEERAHFRSHVLPGCGAALVAEKFSPGRYGLSQRRNVALPRSPASAWRVRGCCPLDLPSWQAPSRSVSHAQSRNYPDAEVSDGEDRGRLRRRAAARVGSPARLRISGRRHQRDHGGLRARGRRRSEVHPGPARGDGGVHGRRARKVYRRARRLPRHLRSRRDPPAERPLRRGDGPPAGGRHRRASRPPPRSAATTSRKSICRTSSRTSRTTTSPR